MIELKIRVDDVDYASIAGMLVPVINEQLERGETAPWMRLLFVSQGVNASSITKVLNRLPQKTKDEMLIRYINHNRDRIGDMFVEMARNNGVNIKVTDVVARDI